MTAAGKEPGFQVRISDNPATELVAERLRDGRVALGTRVQQPDGDWSAGELLLLDPTVQLDLAAWLAPAVEDGWIGTIRQRRPDPLRTAGELYGEGPGAVMRFALDTVAEIPPGLLSRAMVLLANAVGPRARSRLVERLNETPNRSEDSELRRRLADENEAFAYAVAAAALFDALEEGVYPEDVE
ncbi:MAG: hypothetical protein GEU90_13330 [Gemmatimonas sp.]|nr:hypothetical protein [Gemmatimonas sp.]